jgi:hypothetical protein
MHGSYARGDYKEQKDLAPDRKMAKKQLTQLATREQTCHSRESGTRSEAKSRVSEIALVRNFPDKAFLAAAYWRHD